MSKYIRRSSDAATAQNGNHAGFGVDAEDNRLYVNPKGTRYPINVSNVRIVTASVTADASESGTTFIADSTTSVVVALPATAAGLEYTLVVGQLTSSGGHAFSPAAADKIIGNGFTAADDKDAICTAASDVVGDTLTLVGDGSLGWYIKDFIGTWARE